MPVFRSLFALSLALSPLASQTHVLVNRGSSYLGINVVEVNSEIAKSQNLKEERGVKVTIVDADSPAARAGLAVNDVILEFNGDHVQSTVQFVRMVSETPAGRKVTIGIYRNGAPMTLTAQIGARPVQNSDFSFEVPNPPMPPRVMIPHIVPSLELTLPDIPTGVLSWQSSSLGYISEPVDGQFADFFGVKEGVLIRSVTSRSAAERAGLKAGDVIVKADGNPVKNPREITSILRSQRDKKKISLTIVRAHKEMTIELIARNETGPDGRIIL